MVQVSAQQEAAPRTRSGARLTEAVAAYAALRAQRAARACSCNCACRARASDSEAGEAAEVLDIAAQQVDQAA